MPPAPCYSLGKGQPGRKRQPFSRGLSAPLTPPIPLLHPTVVRYLGSYVVVVVTNTSHKSVA